MTQVRFLAMFTVALSAQALADPVLSVSVAGGQQVIGVRGRCTLRVLAEVDGYASGADGLFSYDFNALFDSAGTAEIVAGSVFQPDAGTPMSAGTADASGLTACYGTYFYEQGYGIGGPKELISFDVVGLSPGSVEIAITPDTTIGADFLLHESSTFTVDYSGASMTLVVAGPGDANGDGVVDAADYIALKGNFGEASSATWGDGDFEDDGDVDRGDLTILADSLGATYSGAAAVAERPSVPEPTGLWLFALVAMAALQKKRKS